MKNIIYIALIYYLGTWLLFGLIYLFRKKAWCKWIGASIKFLWLYPKVKRDINRLTPDALFDLYKFVYNSKTWSKDFWFYRKYKALLYKKINE